MLAWTPPEVAAAGIGAAARMQCTISHGVDDIRGVSARGHAMDDEWPLEMPQVNSGRARPEWDLSYESEVGGDLTPS